MRIVSPGSIFLCLLMALFICTGDKASAQVIHACANNLNGDLKVVAAGAPCPRNWSPLSWNVAGPQGPAGVPGPQARREWLGRKVHRAFLVPRGCGVRSSLSPGPGAQTHRPARLCVGTQFGGQGVASRQRTAAGVRFRSFARRSGRPSRRELTQAHSLGPIPVIGGSVLP
jgi:hypothetical protein